MISSENIFYHEFIGLNVKIHQSTNKQLIGLNGKIIDETKKTLKIETNTKEEKLIPKNISIFHFTLPNGECVEIDGKILVNHPEDRIKKRYKKI